MLRVSNSFTLNALGSPPAGFLTIARITLAASTALLAATPLASARTIRFLVPASNAAGEAADKDLAAVVESYNAEFARKHPVPPPKSGAAPRSGIPSQATPPPTPQPAVQLSWRGQNTSSLKHLITLYLPSDPPELAAVETTELAALARTHLPKPIPAPIAKLAGPPQSGAQTGAASVSSLPFQRSVPVLVADQEMLFRIHADGEKLPRDWDGLVKLAARISDADPEHPPLALPLQGPRGLWIFEALAGKPLWIREAGGLRANRELDSSILSLQRVLAPRSPALAGSEMSWDRALQDFLDRRSPLLITTLDALPFIARKAPFRWKSGLISASRTVGGTDLIVTRDAPEAWDFVRYLYAKNSASRWFATAGLLPLRPDWMQTPGWSQAPLEYRKVAEAAFRAPAKDRRLRSTDAEVVRAHSEWVSALHELFGEPSKRLPTETVFTRLDATLAH
jgi:hypothetical protein